MSKNRVKHIKTGHLGTAEAEADDGSIAVTWDNRTIVTTPREELEWLEELNDDIPFDAQSPAIDDRPIRGLGSAEGDWRSPVGGGTLWFACHRASTSRLQNAKADISDLSRTRQAWRARAGACDCAVRPARLHNSRQLGCCTAFQRGS